MQNIWSVQPGSAAKKLPTRRGAFSLIMMVAALAALSSPRAEAQTSLPIHITGVSVQNGQLVATGTLKNQAFATLISLTATPSQAASCPILNLRLAPINLDLLGLDVTTSSICLDITAQQGGGNLLGNLLCQVSRLLNQGVSLPNILQAIGPVRTSQLLAGLTTILDNVLGQILSAPPALTSATGACPVLHLALGPVNLNLLGLVVHLDNCANTPGPVIVDISAQPSTQPGGGLLGDLLCSLPTTLGAPAILQALVNALP
jgi:hypothetical protein